MPAPVSPVIAFSPDANGSSASRIRTRFSIRRLRSKGVAVAVEEGHLGEQREQRAPVAEADRGLPSGARARRPRCRRRSLSPRCVRSASSRCGRRARGRAERRAGARAASVARRTSPPSRRAPRPAPGRRSRGCTRSSPVGLAQITPSHGWTPRSSPPTAQASSTIRPIVGARADHVVDRPPPPSRRRRPRGSAARRPRARRRTRARAPPPSRPAVIAERNPTRPKLTPITGTVVPRNRCSARSIVPSPPSTTARSTSSSLDAPRRPAARRDRLDARAAPRRSRSGSPWRDDGDPTDAAQTTASSIQRSSSSGRSGSRSVTRWRKSSRFPFGSG